MENSAKASWGRSALDLIARRFTEIKSKNGPDSRRVRFLLKVHQRRRLFDAEAFPRRHRHQQY